MRAETGKKLFKYIFPCYVEKMARKTKGGVKEKKWIHSIILCIRCTVSEKDFT